MVASLEVLLRMLIGLCIALHILLKLGNLSLQSLLHSLVGSLSLFKLCVMLLPSRCQLFMVPFFCPVHSILQVLQLHICAVRLNVRVTDSLLSGLDRLCAAFVLAAELALELSDQVPLLPCKVAHLVQAILQDLNLSLGRIQLLIELLCAQFMHIRVVLIVLCLERQGICA